MGWKVAGYTALELVGFGASGEVWRGVDEATGETVALKRLRIGSDTVRDRLRREAALLATLDHPHLIRLRETILAGTRGDPHDTLVLDYAGGGSLALLLRLRRRLTPGEVVTVIAPIAAALAYAHGEGLVHGDVTPANILFTDDGRPLLVDLGVARALSEPGVSIGTPEYVDPVIARGGSPGQRSDVFSVAAVAFHALAGVPPWNAATADDTVAVAAGGGVPDLAELAPDAPPELVDVILRGLSPDPSARGTAAELALDVRCACRPEPVDLADARPTTIPSAARPVALTHEAPYRADGEGGRHRRPAPERPAPILARIGRHLAGVGQRSGVRALALAAIALAGAGWLGVAWGSAGGGSDAETPRTTPVTRSAPTAAVSRSTAPTAGQRTDRQPRPTAPPRATRTSTAPTPPVPTPPARTPPARIPPARTSPAPPPPVPTPPARTPPARIPPATATATSSPGDPAAARWTGVLAELDRRRSAALATVDGPALHNVYADGSVALARDLSTVRQLAGTGRSVSGATHEMRDLQVVRSAPGDVVVRVRQSMRSYSVRTPTGAQAYPPSAPVDYAIELRRVGDSWRIWSLERG